MYEIKKQLAWSALKVGIVITAALVTLLVTVFFAGNIEHLLSPKEMITIDIKDVGGLRRGSPVWFSGVEVGSVKSIDLHPQHGTLVTILIDRDALKYIRKDTRAAILTMGLLGDKYIEISSGSPDAPPLRPGDMITGSTETSMQKVMATGATSLLKLNEVIEQLGSLAVKIEKGEGTLALLLSDPSLYNNLKDASARISLLAADLQSGKGTMGKLIEDDRLYLNLQSAADSFERFGYTLNHSQGTLNRFIEDPGLYENLARASERLSSILQGIDSGKGVAGLLIKDEELARELADTIRELKELTADIRKNPTSYFKFSIF
jgi:phospholipid/cholesterol/gamma-HCH transport system substrate-binding protein